MAVAGAGGPGRWSGIRDITQCGRRLTFRSSGLGHTSDSDSESDLDLDLERASASDALAGSRSDLEISIIPGTADTAGLTG